ncbi:transketolase [Breznakia pachnodae]|uniref:Transketolase n=1 Tax=Breznakia pachnodae TaxID=265178 RepID=A0ABU0E3K5_9FIRM|nr:transketolase [Breznakia pachnodae]MDQ0361469.1 transketolase [Breznakia pachnodae]
MNVEKSKELLSLASSIREKTVKIVIDGNGGHIGGDLSEIDILVSLFEYMKHDPKKPQWSQRDYFILSKGHAAEAYYAVLQQYGYLTQEDLDTFGKFGSKLGGHPTKKLLGVEANTGSLGHGLGIGTGMALGLKMNGQENRVFVLTGDGELAEGSNWEAAMAASAYKLSNLTWIIDRNHLQISGNTEEVMPLENLVEKVESFGFHVIDIDGHNFEQIFIALDTCIENKPVCIIANTVKGKGLYCAENNVEWHHKTPSLEQYEQLKKDMKDLVERGDQ